MDHKLLPKHGKEFYLPIDLADKYVKNIVAAHQQASISLGQLLEMGMVNGKLVGFPCRQCVRDVALQFHDLSELLKELAEKK